MHRASLWNHQTQQDPAGRAAAHGTQQAVMASANKIEHKPMPLGHEVIDDMAGSDKGGSCQGGPSEGCPSEDGLSDGGPLRVGPGGVASVTVAPLRVGPAGWAVRGPSISMTLTSVRLTPSETDPVRVASFTVTPGFTHLLKHLRLTLFCTAEAPAKQS